MRKIIAATVVGLLVSVSFGSVGVAQEKTAEQLVASKKKANMTYKQLMEIMGKASAMIHEGIIRENQQMVQEGANIILNHPAPKHKPWSIMAEADQKDFKMSLMSFNKLLDGDAALAATEAAKGNWDGASKAAHDLMGSCISCHAMWRAKVK